MQYGHILRAVANHPWAILPEKMHEILAVLAHRAAGHHFTPEEIQAAIGREPGEPTASQKGAVAVIPLRGVIAHRLSAMGESSGGMSAERFAQMVNQAAANPSIGSIVLDVDSPGGTINGVSEAAEAVFKARESKRVVAVANGAMASAAYWIGSQASEIVAVPGVLDRSIGSIGVFMVHEDLSAHLEREGIKVSLIKAGKHKAAINPFQPLTAEQIADLQASVDAAYGTFVKTVARGRGVGVADVRNGYGEGKALNAHDAKEVGLIDRIASMDDVIGKLVGRKPGDGLRAEDLAPALVADEDHYRRLRLL